MKKAMKKSGIQDYFHLHVLLLIYSLGAVFSKMASKAELLSTRFFLYYGLVILTLFLYAIGWQQILKRIPLVTAFSNKAATVIWGLLWGKLIFSEQITVWNCVGTAVIIAGILLVVKDDAA